MVGKYGPRLNDPGDNDILFSFETKQEKKENSGQQNIPSYPQCFIPFSPTECHHLVALTLPLPNRQIMSFYYLKIHFHCKMNKQFSYNLE